MFRKLAIIIISVSLIVFNANAESDGELSLKKCQSGWRGRLFFCNQLFFCE